MWTADLNLKYKIKELLKQKVGKHFMNLGVGKDFFQQDIRSTDHKRKIRHTGLY